VPILEQLNATASVDQNLATQFRLAFNPLLHSDSTRQALYSLEKALIQELRSKNDAVIAPLSLMIKVLNAQQSFVNSTKEAEISRIQHEESRIRYDKGIDTLASYRSAFRTATNAANALVRAEQNLAQQSNSLKQLIGKDQTAIVLAWGIQELEVLSSWLANKQANTSSAHHSSVELAYIDVKSAKSSLDSIWLLDPTVSLSFSLNANPATQASISSNLSASVSIGPQSWKQTERDFSQKNLALITQTWEQSKINAQQELELIKSNLALHEKTLILRTIAREEAREVLAETRLLFKSGRASELDVLDAELSFEQAVSDYLVALGEKINTQLSLLVFQN
jgi:outer membrane protein TolC